MNSALVRHVFWGSGKRGSFRTLPIRMGGRFVGMDGPFLGQDTGNRLEALSLQAIQNRVLITPPLERLQDGFNQLEKGSIASPFSAAAPLPSQQGPAGIGFIPGADIIGQAGVISWLSPSDAAALAAIAANPTSDELSDLAMIDGFFPSGMTPTLCTYLKNGSAPVRTQNVAQPSQGAAVQNSPAVVTYQWLTAGAPPASSGGPLGFLHLLGQTSTLPAPGANPDEISAITGSSFFCGTPQVYPDIVTFQNEKMPFETDFGINPNQTWGAIKLQVQNAVTVMGVLDQYPFPPPIDQYPYTFWLFSIGDILEMIQNPSALDPQVVEYWVTLSVLQNYSAMVDAIQATLKAEEKRVKRKAMMAAIGLAVAAIVAAYILPAVIGAVISAVKTGLQTYTTIQQQQEAAKQMADASMLFSQDAPAFSREVDKAANMIDAQAAADEKNAPLSAQMQAALQEVGASLPSGISPLVPIGGGIAVIGIAAYFIFFR